MTPPYDLAVIGGGIMGATAAIRAAEGGMRVALFESSAVGLGASGVNAGTLSLQIKRVALMPYALRGHALWAAAGDAVGFRQTGGLTLAFTAAEAALLEDRMAQKRAAGADIMMLSKAQVGALEPGLSSQIDAASWCADDGYADASLTGRYYRDQLGSAGVSIFSQHPVTSLAPGFVLTAGEHFGARRLLLAAGGWLRDAATMLGVDLPVAARVNTVSVTERARPLFKAVVGHATGLLTLKQKGNGSVLVGGGWQGQGAPTSAGGGRGRVDADTLLPNLRLAVHALPALAGLRLLRCWTGFEAHTPDYYPLAGPLPGVAGAFVLGCVRGGYTIGPYIGRLMGDLILDRKPELPLFDPARFIKAAAI